MSVWLCLPSARPTEETEPIFALWRERDYKIALWLDGHRETVDQTKIQYWINGGYSYPGYAAAVNALVFDVLNQDPSCQWIVCAGDDTEPDANHSAEEIANECNQHFRMLRSPFSPPIGKPEAYNNPTFGVMQCTGDRWGDQRNTHVPQIMKDGRCSVCGQPKNAAKHLQGAYIDRVAGSPWMGREFCLRVNQGRGPLWPEYFHMGVDEELQAVATRMRVFWQRPDLIHLHKHWGRGPSDKPGSAANMPEFLKRANSVEEWHKYKKLFAEREAAGFPGSELL